WLLLIGRLLCSAASLACRRLVLRLVLRRGRIGLAAALSGRVLLRPGLALAGGGRLASAGRLACRLAALLANLVRQPQRGHRAGINAAGRLDALLPLEADQRLR